MADHLVVHGTSDVDTWANEDGWDDLVWAPAEATYLAWLDCRGANLPKDDPFTFFLERAKVAFNDGALFGPGGQGFVRLNFGTPRALLTEGLERMRLGAPAPAGRTR